MPRTMKSSLSPADNSNGAKRGVQSACGGGGMEESKKRRLRTGCLACRVRRVRCYMGEETASGSRKACSWCSKKGVECRYPAGPVVLSRKSKLKDEVHRISEEEELVLAFATSVLESAMEKAWTTSSPDTTSSGNASPQLPETRRGSSASASSNNSTESILSPWELRSTDTPEQFSSSTYDTFSLPSHCSRLGTRTTLRLLPIFHSPRPSRLLPIR
ncbi:hypothetical protein T439DRAFT_5614 [Meredithblackwellia eburnea MCA 4105]